MNDAVLVVLAADVEFLPARQILILRYLEIKDHLIAGLGWRGEDIRDAQQEAVLWMIEAIKHYDTDEVGKSNGRSFRSFLYEVLGRSFSNYA